MTTKPHKHAEVIKAWANGETIEWSFDGQEWRPLNNNEPRFDEMLKYRVKPVRPDFLAMSNFEIEQFYMCYQGSGPSAALATVHQVVQLSIEAGMIFTREDHEKAVREACAEFGKGTP